MEEIFGLLNSFADTIFVEQGHTYYKNGKKLISVTGVLKEFQNPFEADKWAMYKALEASGHKVPIWKFDYPNIDYRPLVEGNVTPEDIKKEWNINKEKGLAIGSAIHSYLEGLWNAKKFEIDCDYDKYRALVKQANNLFQDYRERYIPIKAEYVISNKFWGGQMDGFFYDKKLKGMVLGDYKTDKEIKYSNKYQKLKAPLNHLDDCNYVKYSLQTYMYKKIWEEVTGVPIVDIVIFWLCDTNENYEVVKPLDMTKEVEIIWQQYHQQLVD